MAEDFVEEIYKYSYILSELKRGIKESKRVRNRLPMEVYNGIFQQLCDSCLEILNTDFVYAGDLSRHVMEMSSLKDDMMLLSDHVERNVLPYYEEWIKFFANIETDADADYLLKSSDSGYITIKNKRTNKFFHSTYDPMEEAEAYIEYIFNPAYSEYIIYGCGMGYYAYQLYKISDGSVKITIYEPDARLIEYATNYGVLSWIPESVLDIRNDIDSASFLKESKRQDVRVIFHLNEIDALEDNIYKDEIMKCYISYNTGVVSKNIIDINVNRNIQANLPDAELLLDKLLPEVVIVAAGPSLDMKLEKIREWKGKKTIIAVNTVFRKLIQNEIVPDYVVALDPTVFMEKHLQGMENETVPLILDLGVYWKWCAHYNGPKYMAYSTLPNSRAEQYIKDNKKTKWMSGGTVTFLALEFAIRSHAKKIYFIGADFGYPEGKSHAEGTAFLHKTDEKDTVLVEGVSGKKVSTDRVMNIYREAIEKRIELDTNDTEYYNLSPIGAKIKGTKEV